MLHLSTMVSLMKKIKLHKISCYGWFWCRLIFQFELLTEILLFIRLLGMAISNSSKPLLTIRKIVGATHNGLGSWFWNTTPLIHHLTLVLMAQLRYIPLQWIVSLLQVSISISSLSFFFLFLPNLGTFNTFFSHYNQQLFFHVLALALIIFFPNSFSILNTKYQLIGVVW